MTGNYYHGDSGHPYHLSVGALVMNEKGEILVHHYSNLSAWGYGLELGACVLLMRESVEFGETLEQALHRGLMEEFGTMGTIVTYIGSIVSHFRRPHDGTSIEKTTVYFLVTPTVVDFTKRKNDIENTSELMWKQGVELVRAMREQSICYGRDDINESVIIERGIARRGMLT